MARGILLAVCGVDGCGKSTQLRMLEDWLKGQGLPVMHTEWNSSDRIKPLTKALRDEKIFIPATYSLFHAADFADRWYRSIEPALKSGFIITADRWIYTAFARDGVRGCNPQWLRDVYSFAPQPDIVCYFTANSEVTYRRFLTKQEKPKYYEYGGDLELHPDIYESFKIFQGRQKILYDEMVKEFGFKVIDATLPIVQQHTKFKDLVSPLLEEYSKRML